MEGRELARIIWEEKYMLSRERNHKIQSQLHLRQQVAFREEIAQLREELFYMKVIIVIVISIRGLSRMKRR